jgi:hypothetical protein
MEFTMQVTEFTRVSGIACVGKQKNTEVSVYTVFSMLHKMLSFTHSIKQQNNGRIGYQKLERSRRAVSRPH